MLSSTMAVPVYILHVEKPSSACQTGNNKGPYSTPRGVYGHALPKAKLTPVVKTRELRLGYSDHRKAHHRILE